jgi:hypothetical protein
VAVHEASHRDEAEHREWPQQWEDYDGKVDNVPDHETGTTTRQRQTDHVVEVHVAHMTHRHADRHSPVRAGSRIGQAYAARNRAAAR